MSQTLTVPIAKVRANPIALRAVNREDENYVSFVGSIKECGLLSAISVTEQTDSESGEKYYQVVDGLHRYSACKDLGFTEIGVTITDLSEQEIHLAQIVGNIHKIETKPIEYTRQLLRIIAATPNMTLPELAAKLHRSTQWLEQRLSLTKINPKYLTLVNEGNITLNSAYELAKLPQDEQDNFSDGAQTMPFSEFKARVNARLTELRKAKAEGRAAKGNTFEAVPFMRKPSEIHALRSNPAAVEDILSANKVRTPLEAAMHILQWAVNLDPTGVAIQREKFEAREKEKQEKAAARARDKAAKATAALA